MQRSGSVCPECQAENLPGNNNCSFCGKSLQNSDADNRGFRQDVSVVAAASRAVKLSSTEPKDKLYICPTCNTITSSFRKDPKKGTLCPSGHRIYEKPQLKFAAGFVGYMVTGALVYSLTYYAPTITPSLFEVGILFRISFLGYAVFNLIRGLMFLGKPEPTRMLARDWLSYGAGGIIGFAATVSIFVFYHSDRP